MIKKSQNIYIKTQDYFKSGESFELLFDEHYQMLVTFPQPVNENLEFYYESDDYISHTDTKKGIMPFLYQKVKFYSLNKKIALINSMVPLKGKLLDIGAGTGDFCKAALNKSWDVSGVEPSKKAREIALEKGVPLSKSLADYKGQLFDVITLWHVLEHLPNLDEQIQNIKILLKPNGILIIAVPNYNSYDAMYYKEYWAAYDVPRHLWHFSRESMKVLFGNSLKLLKIKPMIFDSFYVSLLSEKYKSGSSFSLKALFVGLLSNIKAISSKEYSSLIYCFQKPK
ncbi:methyltransferase [Patiriisocius marinistellae]|uniref:Methyltransferase n=1 Tax=Patiriisocius marinistellae TaxID=2494560 RepID=A0A5J4FUZ8_9FLAO|nr:class I SAM-dependent methyltransferase [Patiriisocius marinistellae]GEQ84874.1 methyltransferase [Patiriisocius marinistellae]